LAPSSPGADRIAANGDTANKIGTNQIAVLARENNVPFYIAAPISTFDLSIPDGGSIPIESARRQEVTHFQAPHAQTSHAPCRLRTSPPARSSMGIAAIGMERSKSK